MNLPSMPLQEFYGALAWAVVLAAVVAGLISWWRAPSRAVLAAVVAVSLLAAALPGELSFAHWLRLALQLPSPLLAACCALTLRARWRGEQDFRVVPVVPAIVLAVTGTVLYLDSSAWLSLDLYAGGFGNAAAVTGLLIGLLAVLAIVRHLQRLIAAAVLVSLAVFALARLPTGNLWDALLDPLLWIWMLMSLGARVLARMPAPPPANATL